MSRLWIRVIKNHKTIAQEAVPCAWGEEKEALAEALKNLDDPMPMWLNKHEKEFSSFRHTAFTPEHFVEDVRFDRLEIEYLDDSGVKRKSADPRNQF